MSTNKTQNYQLNQWVKSDQVKMEEFNADNAKIDAALASKASASALSSLQSVVNGKASASAVSSLQSTVAQHTASLAGKGNCILYTTSYAGSGRYGAEYPTSLTFPGQPLVIFIAGPLSECLFMFQGVNEARSGTFGSGTGVLITWSGNSVSWYTPASADSQMDQARKTYRVFALLKAD